MFTHAVGVQAHLCLAKSYRFKSGLSHFLPLLALKGEGSPIGGDKMMGPPTPIQQWPRLISYLIPQEQTHLPTHNPACVRKTRSYHQPEFPALLWEKDA